jgi:hypothetical protein
MQQVVERLELILGLLRAKTVAPSADLAGK